MPASARQPAVMPVHTVFFWGRLARLRQHRALEFPQYAPMASQPRRAAAARPAPFLRAARRSGVVGRLLPKWVADAKLHAEHPELFDGSREAMLEIQTIRGSGLGVFVRRNVSIHKGTILGAYGGNIGPCLGADDYTVEMPHCLSCATTGARIDSLSALFVRPCVGQIPCKRVCTTTRARAPPCSASGSSAAHCPAYSSGLAAA